MFVKGILIATLVVLETTLSLPVNQEKIDPVDMAYYCLRVKTDDGNDDKSPVLLIHGLGSSHRNWYGLIQVLALRTQKRICAIDLRNHGESPWNDRADVAALAVDIDHFLDKQNIKKVNIIGHSLGGKTAVHYALNNPDRVDSIVVEDMRPNGVTKPAFQFVQTIMVLLQDAIDAVPEGVDEEEAKKSIVNFLSKKLKEVGSTEELDESAAKHLEIRLVEGKWQWKMNLKVLSAALKDEESMLTASSGLFPGPALFIYGTKSPFFVGEDEDNILKLFPTAKLVPVKGAGHAIHGLFREFDDEVIKFLNELN